MQWTNSLLEKARHMQAAGRTTKEIAQAFTANMLEPDGVSAAAVRRALGRAKQKDYVTNIPMQHTIVPRFPVKNAVVVSDLHSGCKMGLCSPGKHTLDEGGTYEISAFQKTLWQYWLEFHNEWVPRVCRGDPFVLILNGDSTDGVHHGTTTQISHNLLDQKRIARECLQFIIDKPECIGLYFIRGTEAHVGQSGVAEEDLAETLGAIPDAEGKFARYELWKLLGGEAASDDECALLNVMHHIGTAGSAHYESSALCRGLSVAFGEAGSGGVRPPDVVIRAHRHRFGNWTIQTRRGKAICVTTPGWQGKTPLVYRIAGGRQSTLQFGGIMIRKGDEEHYLREFVKIHRRPGLE